MIRITFMIFAYPISKQPFEKFVRALFNRPLKPIICSSRAGLLDGRGTSFCLARPPPNIGLKLPGKALVTIHRADCAAGKRHAIVSGL